MILGLAVKSLDKDSKDDETRRKTNASIVALVNTLAMHFNDVFPTEFKEAEDIYFQRAGVENVFREVATQGGLGHKIK